MAALILLTTHALSLLMILGSRQHAEEEAKDSSKLNLEEQSWGGNASFEDFHCRSGKGPTAKSYKSSNDTFQSCKALCAADPNCASFDFTSSSSGHVSLHTLEWWKHDACRLYMTDSTRESEDRQYCVKLSAKIHDLLGPISCSNPRGFTDDLMMMPEPGSYLSAAGISRSRLREDVWKGNELLQFAALSSAVYYLADAPGWRLARWYEFGDQGSSSYPAHCTYHQNVAIYQNTSNDSSCVIAFAGTDSHGESDKAGLGALMNQGDWVDNKNMTVTDFCGFPGVHGGYAKRMTRFFEVNGGEVFKSLNDYIQGNCNGKATIVGHSMGGALATLLAACVNRAKSFHQNFQAVGGDRLLEASAVYTFGAPALTRMYRRSNEAGHSACSHSGTQEQLPNQQKNYEVKRLEARFLTKTDVPKFPDAEWCEAAPLQNHLTVDGCFEGLRVFTADMGWRLDPVAAISTNGGYEHPMVNAAQFSCIDHRCLLGSIKQTDISAMGGHKGMGLHIESSDLPCANASARVLPLTFRSDLLRVAEQIDMHDIFNYISRIMAVKQPSLEARALAHAAGISETLLTNVGRFPRTV